MKLITVVVLSIFSVSCNSIEAPQMGAPACSSDWFSLVEKKITTGDLTGHGPDLGSLEWRSVIEFKLEIRNDPKVPPLESDQWCNYINEHYI